MLKRFMQNDLYTKQSFLLFHIVVERPPLLLLLLFIHLECALKTPTIKRTERLDDKLAVSKTSTMPMSKTIIDNDQGNTPSNCYFVHFMRKRK